MAEVVKGVGLVWGVAGITMTAGIVTATAGQAVQSITFNRTSDKYELRDGDGEVVGEVYYNARKEVRITIVPRAITGTNTIANAVSSVDAHLPAPGTKVTMADADGTSIDGDFNVDSVEMRGENTGPRMVDITMHRFDANDVTATVS
jgi:hypothetical protein